MTKKHWLITAIVISSIAAWLLSGLNPHKPQAGILNPLGHAVSAVDTPISKPAKTKNVNTQAPIDAVDPFENEALKAQIFQISNQYQETIKYPIGSQPITNPADAREYREFEQSEVDLPFPESDGDENPIRIAAATDTFQYFQGDSISVRVQISGAPSDTHIEVNGVLSGRNGDVPINAAFSPKDRTLTEFNAVFDTKLAPSNLLSQEMLVKLNVSVGDRKLFTTVAFSYSIASAQIVAVQTVRVEGPNLVIPLQLNVFQNGYYFVNGVLEDAESGRPLIRLQSEQRLQQGNAIINLNAHIAALQAQGSEGPYVLRSLTSYRGAEVGERFDAPASSSQSRFVIQGFPFSSFENEEYVDEQGQERLEFLQNLGDVPDSGESQEDQQEL